MTSLATQELVRKFIYMVQRAFPVRKMTDTKNALCIEAAAMLDPSWISSQNQQKGLIAN